MVKNVGSRLLNEKKYREAGQALEQAWLLQLSNEFEALCRAHGLRLRPPVFELSASTRTLGSWSADTRTMRFSRNLILGYPWWITLEVLKHETAHQMCSELYREDEAGHGPLFRKACERIGVAEHFRGARSDTGRAVQLFSDGGDERCNILEKVRKLLALGRSENEHEAAVALQKARRLLKKHNLSLSEYAGEQRWIRRTIDTGKQRMPVHMRVLAALLESFFMVRVVLAGQYDPSADRVHKTVEVMGSVENATSAEHCWYFLMDRLESLWHHHKDDIGGDRRMARKSYYLGILAGFRESLEEENGVGTGEREGEKIPDAGTTALIAMHEELDRFTRGHFPHLRRRSGRRVNLNPDAYQKAQVVGKSIRWRRPVGENAGGEQRLLP